MKQDHKQAGKIQLWADIRAVDSSSKERDSEVREAFGQLPPNCEQNKLVGGEKAFKQVPTNCRQLGGYK